MVAYVGWHRDTEVPVEVEIIGGIAGKVRCFECEGVPAEEYASWFQPGAVAGCGDRLHAARDTIEGAWAAATNLKTKQPNAEVIVRDLQTGTSTVIEHPRPRYRDPCRHVHPAPPALAAGRWRPLIRVG
jgi:hypothetical protein